ncbi:MAG: GntR family transcriptional regulator [Rhodothermales bacterium]
MLEPGRPRHAQISDWLRQRIEEGSYQTNEKLPSESQLGEQFDVSRITVRRALQTLENEDLIYRRQGLGSFVKETRVSQRLVRLTDFAEDMEAAGIEARSRILRFDAEPASADVAVALDVAVGEKVFRLDRVRVGDGEPFAFDRTWMMPFYAQLLYDHDLERETIYHILEEEYDIPVTRGRFRIEAVNAEEEVAGRLGVPVGCALLLIDRISFTEPERRVYFQRRYYRSDRVAYELELSRMMPSGEGTDDEIPHTEFEPVFKDRNADA